MNITERPDPSPFRYLLRRESEGWLRFDNIAHTTRPITDSEYTATSRAYDTRIIQTHSTPGAMSAPIKMFLSVGDRCNLTCSHCFSDSSPQGTREPQISELLSLISEAADFGVFLIIIGGGEPLIRRDIFEILAHIRTHGMGISLTTNGLKVSLSDIERLLALHVRMNVSLDGGEETHDKVRGMSGAFRRTIHNIEKMRDAGLVPTVRFTLMKSNLREVAQIIEICANLDVPLKVRRGKPSGRIQETDDLILSMTDEYAHALSQLNNATNCGIEDIMSFNDSKRDELLTSSNDCGAGTRVMFVDEDLKLSPCVFLGSDFTTPPWQPGHLRDAWANAGQFKRARGLPVNEDCTACERHRTCHAECPAMRMAATGSYGGMDPSCPKPVLLSLGPLRGGADV